MRAASISCVMALFLSSMLSHSSAPPSAPVPPDQISLLQLIATAEKYEGKQVAVIGFLGLEFEGELLYLHKEDYKEAICKNSVWVGGNRLLEEKKSELNMHYVFLVGTFRSGDKGHRSEASGALVNITSAHVWPPQDAEPKQ